MPPLRRASHASAVATSDLEQTMNAWRFQMRGGEAGGEVLEIDVFGVVGEDWFYDSTTAESVRRRLKNTPNLSRIKVTINSDGGDAFEGFAIYNLLKDHKAQVEVDIIGIAASAASIIAMAGDTISIAANGWMMIHNAAGIVRGESEDMKRWGDVLQKISEQAADIYAARTGLSRERCIEMMSATTWMTAAEAKEFGFVDSVVPFKKGKQALATQRAGLSAGAHALAFMKIDEHENMPYELRAAIDRARAEYASTRRDPPFERREQQQLFPDPVGPAQQQQPRTGEETANMSEATLNAFLATAGIATVADLNARLAQFTRMEAVLGKRGDEAVAGLEALRASNATLTTERDTARTALGKVETMIGKTGEEAIGTLAAMKQSHEELPGVRAELAKVLEEKSEGDLVAALEKAKTENKHTPAREENVRKMLKDKELTHKAALAMIGEWGVVAALAASRDGSKPEGGSGGPAAAADLKFEGKTYAELKPAQRAKLMSTDRNLYDRMKADYEDSKSKK